MKRGMFFILCLMSSICFISGCGNIDAKEKTYSVMEEKEAADAEFYSVNDIAYPTYGTDSWNIIYQPELFSCENNDDLVVFTYIGQYSNTDSYLEISNTTYDTVMDAIESVSDVANLSD